MVLDKEKPCVGRLRDLNLEAVSPTTDQVTNCSFGVVK
jgi:hypothetical protein